MASRLPPRAAAVLEKLFQSGGNTARAGFQRGFTTDLKIPGVFQAGTGGSRFAPSVVFDRAPAEVYQDLSGLGRAGFVAGRVARDFVGHGTRSRLLFDAFPLDFVQSRTTDKGARSGFPSWYNQTAATTTATAFGIAAGNVNPLNLAEAGRPAGFAAVDPREDNPRQSNNPASEWAARAFFGRTGRLLPYQEFAKERPGVSEAEYNRYKRATQDASAIGGGDGYINLGYGALRLYGNNPVTGQPTAQVLGYNVPITAVGTAAATAAGAMALGRRLFSDPPPIPPQSAGQTRWANVGPKLRPQGTPPRTAPAFENPAGASAAPRQAPPQAQPRTARPTRPAPTQAAANNAYEAAYLQVKNSRLRTPEEIARLVQRTPGLPDDPLAAQAIAQQYQTRMSREAAAGAGDLGFRTTAENAPQGLAQRQSLRGRMAGGMSNAGGLQMGRAADVGGGLPDLNNPQFVNQQLAAAQASGDTAAARAWGKEAQRLRVAALNTDLNAQKQNQTGLFDPLQFRNDTPLLNAPAQPELGTTARPTSSAAEPQLSTEEMARRQREAIARLRQPSPTTTVDIGGPSPVRVSATAPAPASRISIGADGETRPLRVAQLGTTPAPQSSTVMEQSPRSKNLSPVQEVTQLQRYKPPTTEIGKLQAIGRAQNLDIQLDRPRGYGQTIIVTDLATGQQGQFGSISAARTAVESNAPQKFQEPARPRLLPDRAAMQQATRQGTITALTERFKGVLSGQYPASSYRRVPEPTNPRGLNAPTDYRGLSTVDQLRNPPLEGDFDSRPTRANYGQEIFNRPRPQPAPRQFPVDQLTGDQFTRRLQVNEALRGARPAGVDALGQGSGTVFGAPQNTTRIAIPQGRPQSAPAPVIPYEPLQPRTTRAASSGGTSYNPFQAAPPAEPRALVPSAPRSVAAPQQLGTTTPAPYRPASAGFDSFPVSRPRATTPPPAATAAPGAVARVAAANPRLPGIIGAGLAALPAALEYSAAANEGVSQPRAIARGIAGAVTAAADPGVFASPVFANPGFMATRAIVDRLTPKVLVDAAFGRSAQDRVRDTAEQRYQDANQQFRLTRDPKTGRVISVPRQQAAPQQARQGQQQVKQAATGGTTPPPFRNPYVGMGVDDPNGRAPTDAEVQAELRARGIVPGGQAQSAAPGPKVSVVPSELIPGSEEFKKLDSKTQARVLDAASRRYQGRDRNETQIKIADQRDSTTRRGQDLQYGEGGTVDRTNRSRENVAGITANSRENVARITTGGRIAVAEMQHGQGGSIDRTNASKENIAKIQVGGKIRVAEIGYKGKELQFGKGGSVDRTNTSKEKIAGLNNASREKVADKKLEGVKYASDNKVFSDIYKADSNYQARTDTADITGQYRLRQEGIRQSGAANVATIRGDSAARVADINSGARMYAADRSAESRVQSADVTGQYKVQVADLTSARKLQQEQEKQNAQRRRDVQASFNQASAQNDQFLLRLYGR